MNEHESKHKQQADDEQAADFQSQTGDEQDEQDEQDDDQEGEEQQSVLDTELTSHQQFLLLLAAILYNRAAIGGLKDAYQNAKNLVQLLLDDEASTPPAAT